MSREEVQILLDQIRDSGAEKWRRDHAMVFFGFHMGLRASECARLSRSTFRHVNDHQYYIRRSKRTPRIQVACRNCHHRWRTSCHNDGCTIPCTRCGEPVKCASTRELDVNPPEVQPPTMERYVGEYYRAYEAECMKPDCEWLFPGYGDAHIGAPQVQRIFAYHLLQTNLDPAYSYHALRHGRGVFIHDKFERAKENPLLVVKEMLGHKSINSTQIYAHMSDEKKARARELIEDEEKLV